MAPNKFLAKIASDWHKPDGLFVIQPENVETFLSPLPVRRLPGVGKVTEKRLEKVGIQTVGDLRGLDAAALEAHFGLKDATVVDTIRIEWPSGIVQELHNVPAKQILTVTESAAPIPTRARSCSTSAPKASPPR